MDRICLCHAAMFVSCSREVTYWERADFAVLYVMFLVFLSLSHRCLGSGVVLNCIDS